MCVYLIHFSQPYHHARHYVGWTPDDRLAHRIEEHRAGQGARLLQVVNNAGISWEIVRTWPGASRTFERRLKNRHNHIPLCPICHPGTHAGDRK